MSFNYIEYRKLYIKIIVLLVILITLVGGGFSLFLIHKLNYTIWTSVLCAGITTAVILKDLARVSAIIVIQFSDVEYSDDIPEGNVIKIKDYLRKKVGYNGKSR